MPRYLKMNGRVQKDIIKRLRKIESSNFSVDDIELLLIRIRFYLKAGTCLRDISDFIAHSDKRDQGFSHKHILEIFTPIITTGFQNFEYHTSNILFTQEQVIKELIDFFEAFEFDFQKDKLIKNSDRIMLLILYILQGIGFEFTIENQKYFGQICSLMPYKGKTALQFLFKAEINGTNIEFVFIAFVGNHPFSWEAIKKIENS